MGLRVSASAAKLLDCSTAARIASRSYAFTENIKLRAGSGIRSHF
jgi:hypothetical protein